VVTTFLAGERLAGVHGVELGLIDPAGWASEFRPAVIDLHELGQAGRVIGVLGLEFFEGEFAHGLNPLP
jgi:hypothetical protein